VKQTSWPGMKSASPHENKDEVDEEAQQPGLLLPSLRSPEKTPAGGGLGARQEPARARRRGSPRGMATELEAVEATPAAFAPGFGDAWRAAPLDAIREAGPVPFADLLEGR
jgi:hypothetical protein